MVLLGCLGRQKPLQTPDPDYANDPNQFPFCLKCRHPALASLRKRTRVELASLTIVATKIVVGIFPLITPRQPLRETDDDYI